MPVLSKEDFFERVHARVGNDTSDDAISFLEDMTDTYNELSNKAENDGQDWERKYNELNESWKKRYQHRFYSGNGGTYNPPAEEDKPDRPTAETITVEDLFKE